MRYKNIVLTFFYTALIVATFFFSIIYYYDPLKLFHKPWVYKSFLQSSMREQAVGLLRHWKYDSIILGTSVLENTSSKEASKILGKKFINISIAGSDYFERSIVLDYILPRKKINTILYSMDDLGATRRGDLHHHYKYWSYLYDDDIWNDIQIYLNSKYLKCLFSLQSKQECMGGKVDFDRPKAWYKDEKVIVTFGGFDNWIKNQESANMQHAFYLIVHSLKDSERKKGINTLRIKAGIERSKKYLDQYILRHVKRNPKTKFLLIIPPYSRLVYALNAYKDMDSFIVYMESLKYLVDASEENENLKVYAWGNDDFVDDIANYRDLTHYNEKINSWMLHAIQRDEGFLTRQNVDAYLKLFKQKALDYNSTTILNRVHKEVTFK